MPTKESLMSLEDLGIINDPEEITERTLLIDGDIVIYRPCCIFNEDTDSDRRNIKKYVNNKIDELMIAAKCNSYIMFVTTKTNFRNDLVDNYKENRKDIERPVNLAWAKHWSLEAFNTHYEVKLEADDLIGIHQRDNTVIWSLDKDLRQIPGYHLDDDTKTLFFVEEEGKVYEYTNKNGKNKIYFDGNKGLYYQLLTGDATDNIIGCGVKVNKVYKSGAKKGQDYIARKGIGPKKALSILDCSDPLKAVVEEYKKLHGSNWKKEMETQANLLFMVREQDGKLIKRWTVDGRDEWFDLKAGKIVENN